MANQNQTSRICVWCNKALPSDSDKRQRYHSDCLTVKERIRKRLLQRTRRKNPEVRRRDLKYKQTRLYKEHQKQYRQTESFKKRQRKYMREYRKIKNVQEREKRYNREYCRSPEVKSRRQNYKRQRYQQEPQVRQQVRDYYYKHREMILAQRKTPEARERLRRNTAKYRATDKGKAWEEEYRQRPEVKEMSREKAKRYRYTQKGKRARKEYKQRPEVKEAAVEYALSRREKGIFSRFKRKDLREIKERDKVCVYCCGPSERWDHIIPIRPRKGERQGQNTLKNLVRACRSCNLSKSNEDVFSWCNRTGRSVPPIVLKLLAEMETQQRLKT